MDTPKRCSVLIGTYNRAEYLQQTLESLCRQDTPAQEFEVIVVDDGSADNTHGIVAAFEGRLHLRYAYQHNSGLASARNHALFLATGDIVFFLDDDDIASPEFLSEHVRTHREYAGANVGVLGFTALSAELASDPVMHYVTEVGHFLFCYSHLKGGEQLDFSYFWGGRSSCKRRFLLEHGVFNPVFRFGCEDIELAYRLSKHGFRVVYNPLARTTMLRCLSYDAFCERLCRQGKSNFVFSQLHPTLEVERWTEIRQLDKWSTIRSAYGLLRKAGREVDAVFRAKSRLGLVSDSDREILYEAYSTAFRASKIKGMADAATSAGYPANADLQWSR